MRPSDTVAAARISGDQMPKVKRRARRAPVKVPVFNTKRFEELRAGKSYAMWASEIESATGQAIDPSTLFLYEKGRRSPNLKYLAPIIAYHRIKLDSLLSYPKK